VVPDPPSVHPGYRGEDAIREGSFNNIRELTQAIETYLGERTSISNPIAGAPRVRTSSQCQRLNARGAEDPLISLSPKPSSYGAWNRIIRRKAV